MASQLTKAQKPRQNKRKETKTKNECEHNLMKEAYQYIILCNEDVFLGIRLRENCYVFTFQPNGSSFWSAIRKYLVCSQYQCM